MGDYVTLQRFGVAIPEGRNLGNGYVELKHGDHYSIRLNNDNDEPCDAEVAMDGSVVGQWRVEERWKITIEHRVDDTGRFTFYVTGTAEALASAISEGVMTGLIAVTFKRVVLPSHSPVPPALPSSPAQKLHSSDKVPPYFLGASPAKGDDFALFSSRATPAPKKSKPTPGAGEFESGGTGLSGHSSQTYGSVTELKHDPTRNVTIHLRLVARKDGPRPLPGKR